MATIPFYSTPVACGFPSPAQDYSEKPIDFNQYLISNPAATFCFRVYGHSMMDAGILENDLILVDRSRPPAQGDIVVASINGEFLLKYWIRGSKGIRLRSANPDYEDIVLSPEEDVRLWGVATKLVRDL